MGHSRERIALNPAEVREYLMAGRTAVLVTLDAEGYPEPVAMWYLVEPGDGADYSIWMRTYAASQKAVNLLRDPRAALLVEGGEHYAELTGVQLVGRVEVVDDVDRVCDVMAGLLVKYEGMDPADAPAAREAYRARAAKQRALRFVVERTASWDHARLAGGS